MPSGAESMRDVINKVALDRTYLINYRLSETGISPKGSYSSRYNALMGEINKLAVAARHDETSSFLVKSRQARAEAILGRLLPTIDTGIDSVHVVEIVPSNRATHP